MERWNGLMKIIEINVLDVEQKIIWSKKNLLNIFHTTGQQFVLQACFLGGPSSNSFIPSNYYFGFDNRTSLTAADTITTVVENGEPSTNGYLRQLVSSTNQFTISLVEGIYQIASPVLTFTASGGSWGPVSNLFMTTGVGATGYLISSAPLTQSVTLTTGQSVSVKMGLALQDCTACS